MAPKKKPASKKQASKQDDRSVMDATPMGKVSQVDESIFNQTNSMRMETSDNKTENNYLQTGSKTAQAMPSTKINIKTAVSEEDRRKA